jgi:hypothetical protein
MSVPASLVKELRERTGAGMMDCKRALAETGGDLEKAADYLREKGLAAAAKKAGRIAAEGLVEAYIHGAGKIGVLVEVNCETDFVAKTDEFNPNLVSNSVISLMPRMINRLIRSNRGIPPYQTARMISGIPTRALKTLCPSTFSPTCQVVSPFVQPSETAFTLLIINQCLQDVNTSKVGPHHGRKPELRISQLPEQKIADAQVTGGANQEIRIRLTGCIKMIRDNFFANLFDTESVISNFGSNCPDGIYNFVPSTVV